MEKLNGYMKLVVVQNELKVPKTNLNTFGKYYFRNCEDILEAVKPICDKHDCLIVLSDKVVNIGDRIYIEATAKFIDCEDGQLIEESKAYAREPESKKGFDEMQLTGATSSYARKYALNGLLCIDDTKDADTTNVGNEDKKQEAKKPENKTYKSQSIKTGKEVTVTETSSEFKLVSQPQLKRLYAIMNQAGQTEESIKTFIKQKFNIDSKKDLNQNQYKYLCDRLELKIQKEATGNELPLSTPDSAIPAVPSK